MPTDVRRRGMLPTQGPTAMAQDVNVLALLKGTERYVFVYDDDSHAELLQAVRDQAAAPDLSLTWFDANVLTRKAREQFAEALAAPLR